MSKGGRNAYLRRKEANARLRLNRGLAIHCQIGLDAALIAANEVLGMGAGRAEAMAQAYQETYSEICDLMADDAVYSFEVIDRRLKPICGDKFQPWQERYGSAGR